MSLLKHITDTIDKASRHGGVIAMMEIDEQSLGYEIIKINSKPWYSSKDWLPGVVSTDGQNVLIVAICAAKQRTGAFRRMIAGIKADGLRPVVVEPLPEMKMILTRWGWQPRHFGKTFHDRHAQWAENWLNESDQGAL